MNLPDKQYDIILTDPPWEYDQKLKCIDYPFMSDIDIALLPISELLSKRGIVFCWATGPKLDLAIKTIGRWGLQYHGVAFIWLKSIRLSPERLLSPAHGVISKLTKQHAEYVLFATHPLGKQQRYRDKIISKRKDDVDQLVIAPKRESCRKPDEVRDMIEELFPWGSKLEMFAREESLGWDSWGYEVGKFVG